MLFTSEMNSSSVLAVMPEKNTTEPVGPLNRGNVARAKNITLPNNGTMLSNVNIAALTSQPFMSGSNAAITPSIATLMANNGGIFASADLIQSSCNERVAYSGAI